MLVRYLTMGLAALTLGPARAQPVELRTLAVESVASLGAQIDAKRMASAMGRAGLTVTEAEGLDDWTAPPPSETEITLLYYSGLVAMDEAGAPTILGRPLAEILDGFGPHPVVLALEDCFARDGFAGALAGAKMPPLSDTVTVLATAGPEGGCRADLRRLTDRLASGDPGAGGEIWHGGGGEDVPLSLGVWSAVIRGAQVAEAGPEADQTFSLVPYDPNTPEPIFEWTDTGIRIPAGAGAVTPILVRQSLPDPILTAPAPGQPQPSVLIGRLPDSVGGPNAPDLLYRDLDALEALRQADLETFVILLASGQLDPPVDPDTAREELLSWNDVLFGPRMADESFDPVGALRALALQGALRRMGCYTRGLDGDWGPGSIRAAQAYAVEQGSELVETAPSLVLWRTVISQAPVTCPVVAPVVRAAPAANRAPTRQSQTRTNPPRRTAPAQPAAPASRPVNIPFN